MTDIILEMRDITKSFSGVKALDRVNLEVKRDEIHALVGENGAGKSTLMKILSGVYPGGQYDGSILFENNHCNFKNIADSEEKGIVIIHQELALIPYLSLAENIFLGNERAKAQVINWDQTFHHARELLGRVGLSENPATLVGDIGVGKQQLVEIAKALSKKVKLLILDEPTAALNDEESEKLLQLLLGLKRHGVTSILISHKLNEISKVADNITVIRDGKTIETMPNIAHGINEERIIKSMVGRELTDRFPSRDSHPGEMLFEVKDWSVNHPIHQERVAINKVNLNLKRGEVVGLAGLMGAGRTELAMSIFGRAWGCKQQGSTYIKGRKVNLATIPDAIREGLAYVTEDRKTYGLVLINDIRKNMSLSSLDQFSTLKVIDENKENKTALEYRASMHIKCSSTSQIVESLSGGNQQKVVLSKWIMANPDILILDEPTRGIDVGAKYEIYTIINQLIAQGKGVIMISSEMPELLGMCDRIYVVTEGEISGELAGPEATQENIMRCIMSHQKQNKPTLPV